MSELEYLKKKMDSFKARVIDNNNGELYCITCGAEKDLVEDEHNEGVFYCLHCLERAWTHDEMIVEGFEESDGIGD
jgi:late competence protein required for DNA uptake (superfamily II DNA/RNA helicase)